MSKSNRFLRLYSCFEKHRVFPSKISFTLFFSLFLSLITFFDFYELWLTHTFIYYSSLRIIIYYKCVFGVLCSSRHEKCVDNWRKDEAWSYLKGLKHIKISWMVSWKIFVILLKEYSGQKWYPVGVNRARMNRNHNFLLLQMSIISWCKNLWSHLSKMKSSSMFWSDNFKWFYTLRDVEYIKLISVI